MILRDTAFFIAHFHFLILEFISAVGIKPRGSCPLDKHAFYYWAVFPAPTAEFLTFPPRAVNGCNSGGPLSHPVLQDGTHTDHHHVCLWGFRGRCGYRCVKPAVWCVGVGTLLEKHSRWYQLSRAYFCNDTDVLTWSWGHSERPCSSCTWCWLCSDFEQPTIQLDVMLCSVRDWFAGAALGKALLWLQFGWNGHVLGAYILSL